MAVSDNTLNNYNRFSKAYEEDEDIKKKRQSVLNVQAPVYNNSYADQVQKIYDKIKSREKFDYNTANDEAYKQYAAQAKALNGLAIAGNQTQAQGLTGGYGSTYADAVANQGLSRANENIRDAQPGFMLAAQNVYAKEGERLADMYNAAAIARDAELEQHNDAFNAYNDKYNLTYQMYADSADDAYNQFADERDYWANQYAMEQDQSNWEKEFELQKSIAQKSKSNSSSGKYSPPNNNNNNNVVTDVESTIPKGMYQQIGMNRTDVGRLNTIKKLYDNETINETQRDFLLNYFDLL